MSLVPRSATIQARVFPSVKEASERVLWRIGLNMSEAMELFLRRVIVDERIPFEVVALDARQLAVQEPTNPTMPADEHTNEPLKQIGQKRGSKTQNISKSFSGATEPKHLRAKKAQKKV
jgi:addiction module RelB/DinJ family antitoxin